MRKLRAKEFPSLPLLPTKYLSALYIFSLKGEPVIQRRVSFIYPKQSAAGFDYLGTCVVSPWAILCMVQAFSSKKRPLGEGRKR